MTPTHAPDCRCAECHKAKLLKSPAVAAALRELRATVKDAGAIVRTDQPRVDVASVVRDGLRVIAPTPGGLGTMEEQMQALEDDCESDA